MRPVNIEIENFIGIRSAKVEFRQGVFLIVGQNGAGKSSLLEAIVFALYGTGIRYGKQSPKNYVRSGSDSCEVKFTFLKNGKRYQIVRRISEANGKFVHQAALLENGKILITQRSSVDASIQEIIGASYDSFIRTFLLPQGMATELLTASWSRIEEVVFDTIFPRKVIKTIQDRISERFQEVKTKHEVRQSELFMILKQLEELKSKATSEKVFRLEQGIREIDERLSALELEYETVKKCKELWSELEKLDKEITELQRRRTELEQRVEMERKISSAKHLEPLYIRYKNLLDVTEQSIQQKVKIQDKMNRLAAKLGQTLMQIEEKSKHIEELGRKYENLRKKLDELRMIRQASEPMVQRLVLLESECQKLREHLNELSTRNLRIIEQIKERENEINKAKETLDSVVKEINSMSNIAIAKMASLIAQTLSEGDRCPVCGNEYRQQPILAGEVELGAYESKMKQIDSLKSKIINLESQVQSLKVQQVDIMSDIQRFTKELEQKENNLISLKIELERIGYYPQLAQDIDKFLKEQEPILNEKAVFERQLSALLESKKTSEDAITELKDELKMIEEKLILLQSRVKESEELWHESLKQSGLTPDEFERLREMTIENVSDELKEIQIRLEDCRHKREMLINQLTLGKEESSEKTIELSEKIKQLRKQRDSMINQRAIIQHMLNQIEELEQNKARTEAEFQEIHEKYEVYSLVKSTFEAREFQAYIAKIALEHILVLANQHLSLITEGRFQLSVGSDGFVIHDFGLKRDADGLSGGEKTIVSLALAIAIAETTIGEMEAFFVDEGFSALDSENKSKMASVLKAMERLNKVIGFVTHDPEFAEYFSSKLVVEKGGVVRWM